MDLAGKRIIVTGLAQVIAATVVSAFVAAGAGVIAMGGNRKVGEHTVRPANAAGLGSAHCIASQFISPGGGLIAMR